MAYLLVIAVLMVVVYAVSEPLRAARRRSAEEAARPGVAELEAARDAKYREIRDAELDLRTGKLSEEDHRAIDTALRTEAIEILGALERAERDGTATIRER